MNSQNLVNFVLLNQFKLTKNRNLTFIVQVLAGIWNNIDSVSSRKEAEKKALFRGPDRNLIPECFISHWLCLNLGIIYLCFMFKLNSKH